MDKITPNFLDTDSLSKAVEKILASSKLQPPETFIEMLYRELTGKRRCEEDILIDYKKRAFFEESILRFAKAGSKVSSSTPKSITAIKTIEQLLGVPPAKVNIKTNLKDARFSKGSQKTHKQHKQFSR
jgi:hypothetical protein